MSDRDVDAEFADIVAHWDEVESLPDSTEAVDRDGVERGAVDRDGVERDGANGDGVERNGVNPPLTPGPSPTNPPPTGPFVVWRGAEQALPAERQDEQEAPDPLELSDREHLDSDDDHFEPGPTAPLPPQEDLQFWGIIVGLVAGPLLLLWLVLFRPDVSSWWTLGALAMTISGFVLLVMRQPHSRDDTDPDNGARV